MTASGTTLFQPSVADIVVESYSRLQIRGAQLTTEHIIEARRTINLILQDWSGNRSVNLWAVDLISMSLVAGQTTYSLPSDTIQLLDVYTRQYQIDTASPTTLGAALTPVLIAGVPVVSSPYGEPVVLAPGSGTLTTVVGSSMVQVTWLNHGLVQGSPVGFAIEGSVGGIALQNFYVVDSVTDASNFTFDALTPALFSSSLQGATPLLATTVSSPTVTVYIPSHGLVVGDTFEVVVSTTVGGIVLSGEYTVVTTPTSYSFTFTAASSATSTTADFENSGQLQLTTQTANVQPIDNVLYPLSRTDYASIPNKFLEGNPSSFWFDRQISPTVTLWQVPPSSSQTGDLSYGLSMYRMRMIEDANPVSGQTPDMPSRFYPAFAAEVTAGLAEKYAPEQFMAKLDLAGKAWMRAATEDSENVPWFITPGLSGYYN